MATRESLEQMCVSRQKCVEILMQNNEWHIASYLMGHILECALKATICRVLKVPEYPADIKHRDSKVPDFFRTHFFDRLVFLAGMSQIFSINGNQDEFGNWSQFTSKLPGDWVNMRYYDTANQFDQPIAESLYKNLISDEYGIINTIKKTWI